MQTNGMSTSAQVFTPTPNIQYVATIDLPWSIFSELRPHLAQRFTLGHAAKLNASQVLKTAIPQHCEVSALLYGETIETMKAHFAEDPIAALHQYGFMNDGHCRDLLAKTGHWPAPTTCRATIYAVANLEAMTVCYEAVDSSIAAKVTADKMQSTLGLASLGILPTTPGFVGDNPGRHRSAFPRPSKYYWHGTARLVARARGCPARRIRCNANASNDRYFTRVLGDIRLRDSRDARREHNPVRQYCSGKPRPTDPRISQLRLRG
jgi:hypothetical protein